MYDSDSPNYAEYAVEKKVEGQLRLKRLAMILFYIAIAGSYFAVCVTTFVALIAVLPMLMLILIYFTWSYVSYDVSWRFTAGKMTFYRVYGSRSRRIEKEVLTVETKDSIFVGDPESEWGRSELSSARRVSDFASSASDRDVAVIVFADEMGRVTAVRFNCIRRLAKLLRIFAPVVKLESVDMRF